MDSKKMEELQTLILDQLLKQLKDKETCTPGMLQAALRFLSDNQIQSLPTSGAGLQGLTGSLPFQTKARA